MKRNTSRRTVADLVATLEAIAPARLAEDWDNSGLQTGNPASPVRRVLVALEVSTPVLEEAAAWRADAVVTHHPLLFKARKSLAVTDPTSRLLDGLIRNRIALLAAHTNLDSVADGTNGVLADLVGMGPERRFLLPVPGEANRLKLVVFVPQSHVPAVIEALALAGAGVIGNYTHCTFRSDGTGTFRPEAGANPFAGEVGRFEQVEEARLEAVLPSTSAAAVLAAVRAAHPYDEMAYDLYPLAPAPTAVGGIGLVGALERPTTLKALAARLKKALGLRSIGIVGDDASEVATVSLATGSGGEFVRFGRVGGADAFITGEMNHHDCWEAMERGIGTLLIGHYASEVIVCLRLAARIGASLPGVEVRVSEHQTNPLRRE